MTDVTELSKVSREAKELIQSLLSADGNQLTVALSPDAEDYAKVFVPEVLELAAAGFADNVQKKRFSVAFRVMSGRWSGRRVDYPTAGAFVAGFEEALQGALSGA